ncbi:MAG: TIM44-like domain-containing protein [Cellulosilyticaceae bacterium]
MKKVLTNVGSGIFVAMFIYILVGTFRMVGILPFYLQGILLGQGNYISFWMHLQVIGYVVSLLVVGGSVYYVFKMCKKGISRQRTREKVYDEKLKDVQQDADLSVLMRKDTGFIKDKFMIRAKKMLTEAYTARSKKEENKLRLVLGDTLYSDWCQQMQVLKLNKRVEIYERFFMREAKIVGYWLAGESEYIQVACVVNYKNAIQDVQTGEILEGDLDTKLVKKMKIIFRRQEGLKTQADSDLFDIEHCPGCGAPLAISIKGICEYCGNQVSSGKFQWVIERIEEELIEEMIYGRKGL